MSSVRETWINSTFGMYARWHAANSSGLDPPYLDVFPKKRYMGHKHVLNLEVGALSEGLTRCYIDDVRCRIPLIKRPDA